MEVMGGVASITLIFFFLVLLQRKGVEDVEITTFFYLETVLFKNGSKIQKENQKYWKRESVLNAPNDL